MELVGAKSEGKQRNAAGTKDFNDVKRLLNAKAKGHLHYDPKHSCHTVISDISYIIRSPQRHVRW